jgi:ABC-type glycerol-3-phosphate transport system permease component
VIWPILAGLNLICAFLGYWLLAYAIARLSWRGRGIPLVLLCIFLSAQASWVPQLVTSVILGRDTWWIGQYLSGWLVTAFGIGLLTLLFRDISHDRFDAARLDGIRGLGIGWHIVFPIAKSALLFLVILYLLATCLDYPWILKPHGYYGIITELPPVKLDVISPGLLFNARASVLAVLPLFAVFFLARKLFTFGRTAASP